MAIGAVEILYFAGAENQIFFDFRPLHIFIAIIFTPYMSGLRLLHITHIAPALLYFQYQLSAY